MPVVLGIPLFLKWPVAFIVASLAPQGWMGPMRSFFMWCLCLLFKKDVGGQSMHAGGATLASLAENGVTPHIIHGIGWWASTAWEIYIHKHPILLQAMLSCTWLHDTIRPIQAPASGHTACWAVILPNNQTRTLRLRLLLMDYGQRMLVDLDFLLMDNRYLFLMDNAATALS